LKTQIDRAGELVEKLEKMTADYSDAIGIMRGQFMSLIEVSSTVTDDAHLSTQETDKQQQHHHHHHHHHHGTDGKDSNVNASIINIPAQPQTSGEQNLLQSSAGSTEATPPANNLRATLRKSKPTTSAPSAEDGINMLDQDTGIMGTVPPDIAPFEMMQHNNMIREQNLLQDDEPSTGSNEGKLQRRLFPGGQRPGGLAGVAAPNLGDDQPHSSSPTVRTSTTTTNTRASSSSSSSNHRKADEEEESGDSDNETDGRRAHRAPTRSLEGNKNNVATREGGTGGVEPGSVAYADGLLMQAHENRMDRVIGGMEDLIKSVSLCIPVGN
jgi:hypothetical protein